MKPTGMALTAFENGKRAFRAGTPLEQNPMAYGPIVSLAAWWESGWQQAKSKQQEKRT